MFFVLFKVVVVVITAVAVIIIITIIIIIIITTIISVGKQVPGSVDAVADRVYYSYSFGMGCRQAG